MTLDDPERQNKGLYVCYPKGLVLMYCKCKMIITPANCAKIN